MFPDPDPVTVAVAVPIILPWNLELTVKSLEELFVMVAFAPSARWMF